MTFDLKFEESNQRFTADFDEIHNVSDGGYDRGYAEGYEEGLAARAYETWTITLADGTIVEKEVALL